jgi:hypothetical protein
MSDPISAGILAVGGLFSGLFGAAAERKRRRDAMIYEGVREGLDTKMQGVEALGQGQQSQFENMVQGYRKNLVG